MERFRKIFRSDDEQSYERLAASETLVVEEGGRNEIEEQGRRSSALLGGNKRTEDIEGFSYVEYAIFLSLGISMLWAWNMFLAAGPYFQYIFRSSRSLSDNFQAAEISVSTVTNFVSMLVLTHMQSNANYPRRIIISLVINMVTFALLAASTAVDVSAGVYFGFLMITIFLASLAAGFCQNGIFAYVGGFGQSSSKYTQSIMMGQAVAGVLPCIAQIVSVLSVKPSESEAAPGGVPPVRWTSALAYFMTATIISVITLLAFLYLLARNPHTWRRGEVSKHDDDGDGDSSESDDVVRKSISLVYLFRKLIWFAIAVFVTFAVTMMFPVFTQLILSNRTANDDDRLFQPPSFIPLAFLFWNAGDLTGRMMTAVPSLSLVRKPRTVLSMAVSRLVFIGLYHLCNIRGRGAIVPSDFFYLVVVQLFFGITNGYLGSTCMIAASELVEPEEREAAGGFMGLCLVAGLTVGSLSSFFVANLI